MSTLCKIPEAKNFGQPGPCIVLLRHNGVCYELEELDDPDKNLTFSWSPEMDNWVAAHDYLPQGIIQSRKHGYIVEDNAIYRLHANPVRGVFPQGQFPSILDIVFRWDTEVIIEDIHWDSVVENNPQESFDYITVTTKDYSTGRREITNRRISGTYSFNELRDIVESLPHTSGLFQDFNPIPGALNINKPWFDSGWLSDNHCIVRLEKTTDKTVTFISAMASAAKADR